MNRLSVSIRFPMLLLGLVSWLSGNAAWAQGPTGPAVDPHAGHNHSSDNHSDHNHGAEVIAYRLPDWKEMHFDDAQKAEAHSQTLKQLGCEVKKAGHAGHIDVVYRCPDWKTTTVADHKLAQQWESWFRGSGFDYFHSHADDTFKNGPEVLEFRLMDWKSVHAEPGKGEFARFLDMLKKVGCQVREDRHGDHADIHYRCPIWSEIHLPDHRTAQEFEAWFKSNGFETRHQH